jgi:CheY-like chemotaxis protein
MDNALVSLKMLIVSEAAAERDLVRNAAMQERVPFELVELDSARDAKAFGELLGSGNFDMVLFDSRAPKAERQALLDAVRTAKSRPLAILIGAAEMKTRDVLTDGLAIDGVLAKPIDMEEARNLITSCTRARLPSKALIVDDSSTVRAVIRKVLQASRFHLDVDELADGAAAIQHAKDQRFDIMFLDCNMPGVDGFGTLSELRRITPDCKVVMITGTRDARIEDRARSEGASDFLYKPFFAKDIDAVLSRLFGLLRARWN